MRPERRPGRDIIRRRSHRRSSPVNPALAIGQIIVSIALIFAILLVVLGALLIQIERS